MSHHGLMLKLELPRLPGSLDKGYLDLWSVRQSGDHGKLVAYEKSVENVCKILKKVLRCCFESWS